MCGRGLFRNELRGDGRLTDLPAVRLDHPDPHLQAAVADRHADDLRGKRRGGQRVRVGRLGFEFAGIVGQHIRVAVVKAVGAGSTEPSLC